MSDNLDKLLYDIGEEANARVDFEAMYSALEQQEKKRRAAKSRNIRYMGMAAACVVILGAAAMLPGGLNKAEAEAAPMEYAMETEEAAPAAEAPAAEAPAAEERIVDIDPNALDEAKAYGCDALCADNEYEESFLNGGEGQAVTEEAVAEEEIEEAAPESGAGAGGDACLLNADTGTFEIGRPVETFAEILQQNYYGIIVIPFEKSGIEEGFADISVALCENTAVWNTGSGVYYIEIQAIGSANEFADILRTVCE